MTVRESKSAVDNQRALESAIENAINLGKGLKVNGYTGAQLEAMLRSGKTIAEIAEQIKTTGDESNAIDTSLDDIQPYVANGLVIHPPQAQLEVHYQDGYNAAYAGHPDPTPKHDDPRDYRMRATALGYRDGTEARARDTDIIERRDSRQHALASSYAAVAQAAGQKRQEAWDEFITLFKAQDWYRALVRAQTMGRVADEAERARQNVLSPGSAHFDPSFGRISDGAEGKVSLIAQLVAEADGEAVAEMAKISSQWAQAHHDFEAGDDAAPLPIDTIAPTKRKAR